MNELEVNDLQLLELARQCQVKCLRFDCDEVRTDPWGYSPAGHPGAYCAAHADAL